MERNIISTAMIILYVNAVPFVSRIYRGADWVKQYLPDEGFDLFGILFLGLFGSIPAIPLVNAFEKRNYRPKTWILSIIIATSILVWRHHDYDLASDAQAAVGLVFIPIYAAIGTAIASAVAGVLEERIGRTKE